MRNNKVYKGGKTWNNNMLPGDPQGSPDESFLQETLVFIDSNFLSKVSKHFGKGRYLTYDIIKFSQNLSKEEKLKFKHLFYYTAPPFQSNPPIKKEEIKKEDYDKFISKLKTHGVFIREGRCQRLKIDNEFDYKQKGVDVLIAIDLTNIPLNYPKIKKIIFISSDSDFVPVIKNLEEKSVKTVLYTYYERKRDTPFSRSNELIKSVYKYKLLSKEDFNNAPLNKSEKERK